MTIQIEAVQSMRAIVETTFGTDATSSPGLASFTYVPFLEGSATLALTTDELDTMHAVQSRYEGREKVFGKRSATLSFDLNLSPTGTAAASGVTAITSALGLFLKASMGAERLGAGTTFVTGWTAITGTVTSSAGFVAGGWIGWSNASSVVEWRQIKTLSGVTVTLDHGFSGSPANTNVAYACAEYSFTEDPATSIQVLVSGQESDDRWLLVGGQVTGGVAISIDPSGAAIPKITLTMSFASYIDSASTAATVTGTLADATYSATSPIVGHVGEFRVFTVGAPTLATTSRIHISALAFSPKIAFVPVTSPSGTQTILRYRGARALPPVEGTFTTYYEDLTWWTARSSSADKAIVYTLGTAAGSQVVLAAGTVQILNPQRTVSGEEIAGQTISWAGRRNTDTAGTTEAAKSPVYILLA